MTDSGAAAREAHWTPAAIPDLGGATAVVTGANSGIGLHTALELVRHGAQVVLACRDADRGQLALEQVRAEATAAVELMPLDLTDLRSVRGFAERVAATYPRLDLLVNNAGIMAIPRRTTVDGFEMQLGTNHLGHFALTGLLLPRLLGGSVAGGPARVVTVSSTLHRRGRIDRDNLMLEIGYTPYRAYAQSKLANLLFVMELQRRVEAAGAPLASLGAHPGYAATNLQGVGPQMAGRAWAGRAAALGNRVLAQSAEHGAWPSLRAATDPAAHGGEYYGPGGFAEQRGHPRRVSMTARASDPDDAAWLWDRSVELTGVGYGALTG